MTFSVGPDVGLGHTWPSLPQFHQLAQTRRVIPVVRRLMADEETPVGLYRKLAQSKPGTFLMESAPDGGQWSRYSVIGVDSQAALSCVDGQAKWSGRVPAHIRTSGPVLDVLADVLSALGTPPLPGMPPLTGGMVGFLAYDIVRHWESLPTRTSDELNIPDVMLFLASDLAVLDHREGTLWLIANAINHDDTGERVDEAWADAVQRLDAMADQLAQPSESTVAVHDACEPVVTSRTAREDYLHVVRHALQDIVDGEVFQVVLSQRFDVQCAADALEVYRCLRASNPSPYMYLMRCETPDGTPLDVVGSSPEALVTISDGNVMSHPIAGTRPRAKTADEDTRLAEDLLADPKERAEHLMLVDLARNDLSRVCDPGTVDVNDFMSVEKYSHVMHLVSTVTGQQHDSMNAVDVMKANFPAGTLSGAPKTRAMELIDHYEPTRRGLYGGVVGYFDFAGNMDLAIAIRTAVIHNGIAHVQAGAGIVADSDPDYEDNECRAKAAAVIRAVSAANSLRSPA